MPKYLRHVLLFGILLAIFLSAESLLAQDEGTLPEIGMRSGAPTYGVRGPHPVGYMSFSMERGAPLDGAVWYPALNSDGADEAITYDLLGPNMPLTPISFIDGRAIADAEPDSVSGPYPLIVSSHGNAASFNIMAYQHEQLASYGFVVIAVAHEGTTLRDSMMVQTPEQQAAFFAAVTDSMVKRPLEVTRALDYAETLTDAQAPLAGMIDLDHVGVIGVSYGGYTAAVEAGVRFDFSDVSAFCATTVPTPPISLYVCSNFADDVASFETHLMDVAGIEGEPGAMWQPLGDPRVDAVIGIVPGGPISLISDQGLAAADKPMMIVRATLDEADQLDHHSQRLWDNISSAVKIMVTVENATHRSHSIAMRRWKPQWRRCAPSLRGTKFTCKTFTDHLITAFFLDQLTGDTEARAALLPDAVDFPGIDYQAEGL